MMARKKGLGEKHKAILQYLKTRHENGLPSPTIREIAEACHISSTSLVAYYLKQLEDAGHIERARNRARSIRLNRPHPQPLVSIPVLGPIVASEPIPMPASDHSYFTEVDTVDVPPSLLEQKAAESLFALQVRGNSMIDAMISDGDIVILQPAESAENGDMVAIWLTDEDRTTLKYFYQEGERVRLQPANPTMQPIYVDANNVRVQGKVVAVLRKVP